MSQSLLPPASELAKLTEDQTKAVVLSADRSNSREHSYAVTAMICGTACFLGVVASFVFLVVHGFAAYATLLLGTAVLAIVGQIINSRLRK